MGEPQGAPTSTGEYADGDQYQEQGDGVFFDDGREIELLHYVYSRPDINELRNNPGRVVAAVDDYGRSKKYLMNVGRLKGEIVTGLIREVKPKTMVHSPLSAVSH